jgi:2-polyprenyl-6-methoxyphenol hydroxylase-like FAD-dependent oxidoreductase
MATSTERKGTPAVLKTSSRVVDVDTSTATVILEDGSRFSADLVVGADGVSVKVSSSYIVTFFLTVERSL